MPNESVAKLTDQVIRNTKPQAKQFEKACRYYRGLRLLVQPTGRKSLIMRYTVPKSGGKSAVFKLCDYFPGTDSLATAIKRWARAKEVLDAGRDPARGDASTTDPRISVATYVDQFQRTIVPNMRPGTQVNVRPILGRLCDIYGGRSLDSIKRSDLMILINDAAERGPHAVRKTRSVLHQFFASVASQLDDYLNPLAGTSRGMPKVRSRDRVLDDAELRELLRATSHPFVWLLALTGARRCEISDLKWSEVRGEAFVIPGDRTKTGKTHSVHITAAIRNVLDATPQRGKYVCNGLDVPLSGFSKLKKKMPELSLPWTWHDLRRTFSTGCARLGIKQEVIDACTGHAAGVVQGTYNRHRYAEEMKVCWNEWAAHVEKIMA